MNPFIQLYILVYLIFIYILVKYSINMEFPQFAWRFIDSMHVCCVCVCFFVAVSVYIESFIQFVDNSSDLNVECGIVNVKAYQFHDKFHLRFSNK